ncbi:MAG TPA: hypothetical protein VFJ91_05550 [Gaiellaceae bacterium]|nr:hypothetical protein [Gaiellaceae bacterium]
MRALGVVLASALVAAVSAASASAPRQLVISASDAPTASGDVYRVTLAGRRTNLTHSPFADRQPVATPDGSRIAFLSDRDGSNQIWSVNADGTHLTQLSRGIGDVDQVTPIAWSPDGTRFLASGGGAKGAALWVLQPGRAQKRVSGFWADGGVADAAWSADGREIAYVAFGLLRVTTPSGREVFALAGLPGVDRLAWSARGPLAVHAHGSGRMLDARGRTLAAFESNALAWSPDGRLLASVHGGVLEVRDTAGKLVLRTRIFAASLVAKFAAASIGFNPQLLWTGNARVLVGNVFLHDQCGGRPGVPCPYGRPNVAVAVPSGRTSKPSQRAWFAGACGCRSADGKLLVEAVGKQAFSLRVSRAAGGGSRTLATVPGCWSDGVWTASAQSPRFAGNAVVYTSACDPPANLWLANPDGGGLRRLTDERANQTQPAWSPDGSEFAYVQAFATGCRGCSESIWARNADGSGARQVTTPPDDYGWFDEHPTFSPDGKTILFTRSPVDAEQTHLWTVPAAGGDPKDLGVAGSEPAWGPSRIGYVGPQGGVYTAAPDGSGATRVLASKWLSSPAWSRDGRLAALENKGGTTYTAVVLADGRTTSAVLPFRYVRSLAWSADGTRLLVAARTRAAGPVAVWSVKPDGTDPAQLTTSVDAQGVGAG